MRARELGRRSVVVGDDVAMVGETGGGPDALARIVRVADRASSLRRTADDTDPVERVVVANADILVVVTALAHPPPRTGLVDRCLVAAYDARLEPLLCLTKSDLASPADLVATYGPLGIPTVVTGRGDGGEGVEALRARLSGRRSVLVGHSGVGKSTMVNDLVPSARRATGAVNLVTGRGRHTSSSAVALPLDDRGGWVIDTPGLRSFGLAHVSSERLLSAFVELAPGTAGCPSGCSHLVPECALDAWVAAGHGTAGRLRSLRHLLASRAAEPDG
jgi:ribosome biogenesis GTPase